MSLSQPRRMMVGMNLPDIPDSHTSPITLYGIANCDTVKKARAWLTTQGLIHHFHDFKKHGVPAAALQGWMDALGWEALVNRRGTTWRKLDTATQAAVCDATSASALLTQHTSAIKRPVVEWRKAGVLRHTSVGFDTGQWAQRATELQG